MLRFICLLVCVFTVLSCRSRPSDKVQSDDRPSFERQALDAAALEAWMSYRPSQQEMRQLFPDDLIGLGEMLSRELGRRDKFYEFQKPSSAAGRFFGDVLAKLKTQNSKQKTILISEVLKKQDFRCLSFRDSAVSRYFLAEARAKMASPNPLDVAVGYGMRITLEVLDLVNAAHSPTMVQWRTSQYHHSPVDDMPMASEFHTDGGYLAATVTLSGFGTDYVVNPNLEPKAAGKNAKSQDIRRTRTGRYVVFAAMDYGRPAGPSRDVSDEPRDAVIHRASTTRQQDRHTWVVRMQKVEDPTELTSFCSK